MMDKATRAIHVIYTIKTQIKETNVCDMVFAFKNTSKSTINKTEQFM